MKNWLNIATEAARQAGTLLLNSSAGSAVHVGRDVKLQADYAAEKLILDLLKQQSPFGVLAEESGFSPGTGQHETTRWIVDPLDGSMNFLRGIPLCCVSIALWCDHEPVLGAIYDFRHDEMFAGLVEGAESAGLAELNGQRIHVSDISEGNKAVLCTGLPVSTDFSARGLTEFIESASRYKKIRLIGTAALSLAYVAAGRVDAYRERGIKIWDVAAGVALVRAAGGHVTMTPSAVENVFDVYAHNGSLG